MYKYSKKTIASLDKKEKKSPDDYFNGKIIKRVNIRETTR